MINHQWLEILISITNFHDPIDVQTIEIWLYFPWKQNKTTKKLSASILNCTLKVKLTMTDLLSIKSIIMHKSLLWEGNIIMLTFTTPCANSADDKSIFFLFFAKKTEFDISCKLSPTEHYENTPIQIYWKFYHQKMKIFRSNFLIFFIFLLKT